MPDNDSAHALNQRQSKVLFGLVTLCDEECSSVNDDDVLKPCMVKLAN